MCPKQMLGWAAAIFIVAASIAAAEQPTPLRGKELLDFLGPVPPNALEWTKYTMVDFELYNGRANPPLNGKVGFYVGGHPSFKPPSDSIKAYGHLGRYDVKWYRSIGTDGTISQSALIPLDDYWQVDIHVTAKRQVDVDQLIETIGRLPVFTNPPRHIPAEHPW